MECGFNLRTGKKVPAAGTPGPGTRKALFFAGLGAGVFIAASVALIVFLFGGRPQTSTGPRPDPTQEAARLKAEQDQEALRQAEAARLKAEQEKETQRQAEVARLKAEQEKEAKKEAEVARLKAEQEAEQKRKDSGVPEAMPKGGKAWTVPASVAALGATYRPGNQFWVWAKEDKALTAEGGGLTVTFSWRLRASQQAAEDVFAAIIVDAGGTSSTMVSAVTLEKGATSGQLEASFDVKQFRGSGSIHFFLSDGNIFAGPGGPKVYSNLITFKADL